MNVRKFYMDISEPFYFDVCGQLNSKKDFIHQRRSFGINVLIYVTAGTLYISSAGRDYEVCPGQYIILRAGEEHFGTKPSEGELSYFWAHFIPAGGIKSDENDCEFHRDNEETCEIPEYGELVASSLMSSMIKRFLVMSTEENGGKGSMADYMMSLMLMEVSRQNIRKADEIKSGINPAIYSVCDWIKSNYSRDFRVSEVAARAGYQPDYFSSIFKKNVGVSLTEYTNRIRIHAAERMLSNPEISIREAAYSCGFPDEKYFMKVFKKYKRVTPTEYRQNL